MKTKVTSLILFSIVGLSSIVAQVPVNGLVGYWPFNGNADDESGNGNNGTIYGASLTTDRFGNANSAYNFDGSDDYIFIGQSVPGVLQCTDGITISAWIKPNNFPHIMGGIIASQNDFNNTGYSLFVNNYCFDGGGVPGGIHFQMMNTSSGYYSYCYDTYGYTTISVPLSMWTHVVAVWSGGDRVIMYFNNIKVADWMEWPGPISYSSNNIFTIGKHDSTMNTDGGNNRYFNGVIDNIRIYNRALGSIEIYSLYNEGSCNQPITNNFLIKINNTEVTIYPNPTHDHITIDYGNYSTLDGYMVKITNSSGQVLFTDEINQQQSYIDLSAWAGKGIYFVHVLDAQNNTLEIRKLILI